MSQFRIKEEMGLAGPNINKDYLLASSTETKTATIKVEKVNQAIPNKTAQLCMFAD